MKPILILWTCKASKEAEQIAKALIEQRLIACASIIPSIRSFFRWEGKIEQAEECKVFLKTVRPCYLAVQRYILAHSSYEVPEILELTIEQGNPDYLAWLQRQITDQT
jgi:periplasmic divalent cation tolerance protein